MEINIVIGGLCAAIGALCTAIGAVCGYFVRKESRQEEQICSRLDQLEDSLATLVDAVSHLTVAVATLTATAEANAREDEEQSKTMATILDRALNCQQCFRGPIAQQRPSFSDLAIAGRKSE